MNELARIRLERDHTGRLIVGVEGEIDASNIDRLETPLRSALADDCEVLLDLRGVQYLDSRGLRLLWELTGSARASGGDLVIIAPADSIAGELLTLTGLDATVVPGMPED